MSLTVFISYAKEDQKIAEQYFNWLKNEGFDPWLDVKKLKGGQNWESEIDKAFKKSNVIILLMSPNSINKRGFVQREFHEALNQLKYKLEDDIYAIPVIIESCTIPEQFSERLQFIDNTDSSKFDDIRTSLLTAAEQQSISIEKGISIGPYIITDNKINESWDNNPGYEVEINYPSFTSDVKLKTSSELSAFFMGEAISTLVNLRKDQLKTHPLEDEWYSNLKNEHSEYFTIVFASKNIISILINYYVYFSGAAHGHFAISTFNFDTKNSLIKLSLDDLFKSNINYISEISQLTIKKLHQEYWERMHEEPDEEMIKWFNEGASADKGNFNNFLITEKCITFLFPPYQVGPFAMGTWSIDISYFELRNILKIDGPYSYLNDN